MGQYHYLVNLDKKQMINPHEVGNGLKLKEQVGWPYSTATILVMLLAASSKEGGRGGGDFRAPHPLVGSWARDRIAFVGDYAEPEDIPGGNAELIYQQCAAACGAVTDEKPADREDWTNISPQAREMMGAEFGIRYAGSGWLDIVERKGVIADPPLPPDLMIASKT